jgi:hypothetical protein
MTKHFSGSAQIISFPARIRATVGNHDQAIPAVKLPSSLAATAAFGSGWYHEEAIREAERTHHRLLRTAGNNRTGA